MIASINPASGKTLREFESLSSEEIEHALRTAAHAWERHRRSSFAQRSERVRKLSRLLEHEKADLARVITLEMGKPYHAAKEEVLKCARVCDFYAENAAEFLADRPVKTDASRSFILFEPMGPVLAIMPWNFPFWQVFRFAAPAVMAGNVALLKHASNVPQCALAIADLFRRAGFEAGVFQSLLIESEQTELLINDPRVKAVTLTGSDRAGSEVAGAAGRQIKKAVLELGGSDPFVVMPSAELNGAVTTAVKARTINTGQSCIAAKRFVLADSVYDEFLRRFVQKMKALRVGDPFDDKTEVGPLATEQILYGVHAQVQNSVRAGAKVLTGGRRIDRDGYFYEPTVLADIPPEAPAYREEIFGPVASVLRARDAADALRIANDSSFGLGASVWTRDEAEIELFAHGLEAGMVFINAMVASDPRLPFGGMKRSGYGRELGAEGIREFVNVKTVVIA
ncbi:MAG: NAD-dependent succinate-semialdehyde dehydrogenase [Chthoniobacterales bacterium]